MSATTVAESPLREIIAEVYEAGRETRELAEAAFDIAGEGTNREAAIQGWQDQVRSYRRETWRPEDAAENPRRSGHNNGSGRLQRTMPAGIFRLGVSTNDGVSYFLGDLTAEVCENLRDEFRHRKVRNAAGEKFFGALAQEMAEAGVSTVAELGEERVAALKTKAGFRE